MGARELKNKETKATGAMALAMAPVAICKKEDVVGLRKHWL